MNTRLNRITALTVATALVAVSGGTTAVAGNVAETPVEAAPVAAVPAAFASRFAGGFVGAQVGFGYSDNAPTNSADADGDGIVDNIDNTVNGVVDAFGDIGSDGDGWLGGAFAGYRGNVNRFVYGAEGSYDFSDVQFDNDAGNLDGLGRLKLTAGYDFGSFLLYAAAGAAYADGDIRGIGESDWGWLGGIGGDYLITDQVSAGAEILYHDFGEFGDSGTDVTLTTLQARVSFHF